MESQKVGKPLFVIISPLEDRWKVRKNGPGVRFGTEYLSAQTTEGRAPNNETSNDIIEAAVHYPLISFLRFHEAHSAEPQTAIWEAFHAAWVV